jgi:hypothetical protein
MVVSKPKMNREGARGRQSDRIICSIIVTPTDCAAVSQATIKPLFGMQPNVMKLLGMFALRFRGREGETGTQQHRSAGCLSFARNSPLDAAKTVAAKRVLAAVGAERSRQSPIQMSSARQRLLRGDVSAGATSDRTARTACSTHSPVPLTHAEQRTAHADLQCRECGLSLMQCYLELATHHALGTAELNTRALNRDHGNSAGQPIGHQSTALCNARNVRASGGRRKRPAKPALDERAIAVPEPRLREFRASVRMGVQAQVRCHQAKRDPQRSARDCEGQSPGNRVQGSPSDLKRNRLRWSGGPQGSTWRLAHRLPIRPTPQKDRGILCGDWR